MIAKSTKYFKDHPGLMKKYRQQQIEETKEYILSLKLKGCRKCGEKRMPCLDFHHKKPKEKKFRISRVIGSRTLKQIKSEIKKCELLCKNCHAIKHYKMELNKK